MDRKRMSSVVVPVATVDAVRPHPNADKLEIAEILGWQVVVGKGQHKEGDLVIYVPPDSVVPEEHAEAWGVSQYLHNGRVKSIKLRGEPSFGFAIPYMGGWDGPEFNDLGPGDNVAELLGITKYEPPAAKFHSSAGGPLPWAPDLETFPKYTDIENMRHYPDLFELDELVVVTEKIHGTNVRVGLVNGELSVGTRRRRLLGPDAPNYYKNNVYWWVSEIPGVQRLLNRLSVSHKQVILFGEVYGPKIQPLGYGLEGDERRFRAFDLIVDGRYVDYPTFAVLMDAWHIPAVPELYMGPFLLEDVKALSKGKTTLNGDHIREGVVVKPLIERRDPKIGRLVLKYVSDDYLMQNYDDVTEAAA
jgi:RNA ligase (TIGR02306 family)